MVLNSTPTLALAEEVIEPEAIVDQATPEEELAANADESDDAEDQAAPDEVPAATDDALESDDAPLFAQADAQTYTVKFYERDGSEMSGMPEDIKAQNPSVFAYLLDEDGKIVGWNNFPIDKDSCQVTVGTNFNSGTYSTDGAVAYDPSVHTLRTRIIHDFSYAGEFMPWDMASINFQGKDQFDGYKFKTDDPEPNVFKMQRDWNKQLQVELKYTGSDTGDSAAGTIIVRAKTTTSGWHYFKYPLSQVSWKDGEGTIVVEDWLKGDGTSSGHNYSNAWQNVEAVLFKGNVNVADVSSALESGQGNPQPVYAVAGYILKSGEVESREGSVDEDAGIETVTLPVELDGTPLDPATSPEEILGDAAEYGIVADSYHQTGHTETNFAIKEHITDGDTNLNLDYHEMGTMPFYVGSINHLLWLGHDDTYDAPANLYVTQDDINAGKIKVAENMSAEVRVIPTSQDAINAHVDALINHVDEMSEAMAQKVTIAPKPSSTEKDYVLDTTSLPKDATIYVDATNLTALMSNKKLSIKKMPGQYIVFNVPGKNVNINSFTVSEEGGLQNIGTATKELDKDHDFNEKVDEAVISKICFNLYEASSVNLGSDPVAGAILAPKASDVVVESSSAGWIVAKGQVTTRSEWHFYHKTKTYTKVPDTSAALKAKKTISGGNGTERSLEFELNYATNPADKPVATGTVKVKDGESSPITLDPTSLKYVLGASYKLARDNKTLTDEQIPAGAESLAQLEKDGRATVETVDDTRVWTIVYTLTEKDFTYDDLEKDVAEATITVKVIEDEDALDFVVDANIDPEEAEIKNKAKSESGTLTVTKTVTPSEAATAAGDDAAFTVTIKNADGKFLKADGTLTDDEVSHTVTPGTALTIENVPLGTYNVTETGQASVDEWTFTTDGSTTKGSAELKADGDVKTVGLVNAYKKNEQPGPGKGSLTVAKSWAGDLPEGERPDVSFTVTGPEGFEAQTKKLSEFEGGSWTLSDLTPGTYTVSEDGAKVDGYTVSTTYSVEEGKTEVEADKTATVTVTNNYTKVEQEKGSLTVAKSWAGDLPEGERPDVSFTVSGPEGFEDQTKKLSEFEGGSWTLTDLEDGTYTVTETGAKVDGYEVETTYSMAGGKATIADASAATVTVTNDYTKVEQEKGSLTVAKSWAGDLPEAERPDVSFTVSGPEGFEAQTKKLSEFEGGSWTLTDLEDGTYTVTEDGANVDDYAVTTTYSLVDGKATITDASSATVTVTNDYKKNEVEEHSVKVSKVDVAGGAEVEGAHIQIIDSKGEVVEEWDSTTEPHEVTGLTAGEQYTLKETVAPDGYTIATDTIFTLDEQGNVTGTDSVTEDGTILIEDSKTKVTISKTDIAGGEEVEGAHIQVIDSKGAVVEEWDSTTEPHTIEGKLNVGEEYTLRETVAPEGYAFTTDTTFVLKDDGTVDTEKTTTKTSDEGVLLVEDAKLSVKVSKVDIAGGEEVEGAHIQVLNAEGNVVDEWDSTTEAHEIEGLEAGKTYTLRETVAPDGYTYVTDTTFTVNKDGSVTTTANTTEDGVILIEDAKTVVRISKVDIADGEEIAGAHIQIKNEAGEVVAEWDSDGSTKVLEGVLNADATYTMVETVAPDGYTVATETTFTINKQGNLVNVKSVTKDAEGNDVILINDEQTVVRVSKTDIADGKEVAGAHIQILDDKGGIAAEWDSDGKTDHVVKGLKTGVTYTLHETVAPDGYAVATDTTFVIDAAGNVTATGNTTTDGEGNLVMLVEDAKTKVAVSKTDATGDVELEGAHIQVVDSKGTVVEEWDSTTEAHLIEGLKTGVEYTLKETVAPSGYTITSDTTFTIAADGTVKTTGTTSTTADGTTVILIQDDQTSVKVSKVDVAGGEELEGAHIQIIDSEGTVVEEWDSTTEAHEIVGLTVGETYTLRETVAPEGHTIASDTTFNISADGTVTSSGTVTEDGVILVEDAKTSVKVSKTDIADGEEVEGATIQIIKKDAEGNETVVEEWTSTTEPHTIEGVLNVGEEYILRETVAPDGYTIATDTTFTLDEQGNVTGTDSVTEDGVLLVEDSKTKVTISKTDIANGEEVEGAHIQVIDSKGTVVEEWDSTTEAHEIEGLKTGETYTLRETVAPEGYTIATDTTFVLKADGTIDDEQTTTKTSDDGKLLVEDAKTSVKVSKTDLGTGEELEGAHIQVVDVDGNVFEEWDSTTEAHLIEGLKTNTVYQLIETVAPAGHTIASTTGFMIDETGKVTCFGTTTTDEDGNTVILIEDAKTVVRISKVDLGTGEELEGAHIQVLDKDGNVVDEWDSTNETHVIEGKLSLGQTYTLKETTAPDGYTITSETTFTIDETGKVANISTVSKDEQGNEVVLINDEQTVVRVSKTDIADGKEVAGAHIQILDEQNNVADEWDSDGKTDHVIKGLKTGVNYTLHETVAPNGYTIATDTTFFIDAAGNVTATGNTTTDGEGNLVLLVEDAKTQVRISKADIADGEEVAGAHIQVLDKDGNVVEEWDSTTKAHLIEGLKANETYTLHETVAPEGYTIATDTTFTVNENGVVTTTGNYTTDENGNFVVLVEDAKTSVKVSKTDVVDGEELEGATIQIIDSKGEVVEQWVSTTEPHTIEGLKTGETYTLCETVAPEGYTITTDTTFTIDENGDVTSTCSNTTDEDGTTVLLVEDAKTVVKVSKTDLGTGKELAGATIQVLDKDGKVVDEWVSTTETHTIEGLKTGETYTLRETVAPEGYAIATDTTFTIDASGKVTTTGTQTADGTILIEDAPIKTIKVEKVWKDAAGKTIAWPKGAKVTIELLGNGKPMDVTSAKLWGADKAIKRMTIELDASNPKGAFEELPVYKGLTYSVVETKVTGVTGSFETTVTGTEEKGFTVTNAYKSDKKTPATGTPAKASASSSLAKTGDPAAAAGMTMLYLSAIGSGLATTGLRLRKKRNERK